MPTATPNLPTLEEVRTEKARRSLRSFVEQAWPIVEPGAVFTPGWHIDCICDHLEAVSNGDISELLINMPPRHMKSSAVSVFWPAWEWIADPTLRWLFNSYADTLSIRDSVKCRHIIQGEWYRRRWGHIYKLTSDQNVKSRYENDKTGYRISSSVTGSNTGEGGNRIVVDDPINVLDADSQIKRDEVLRWWFEVMPTRINDWLLGRKVIVMQRAHYQDLSGAILDRQDMHHLCLPAEWEPRVQITLGSGRRNIPQPHDDCPIHQDPRTEQDELLWPNKWPREAIESWKVSLGPYGAAGQLQQRPTPREGVLFKVDMFRPLPHDFDAPSFDGMTMRQSLTVGQGWDLAWSEKESADNTASVTAGIDKSGNVYILNAWRVKADEVKLGTELANHINQTNPAICGIEQSSYTKTATVDLIRRINRNLARGVPIIAVPVKGDKYTRAQLPAGRGQVGMLYADTNAPWWPSFLSELLDFPKGAHDDWVDALSLVVQLLVEKVGIKPLPRNTEYGFNEQAARRKSSWVTSAINNQDIKIIHRNWGRNEDDTTPSDGAEDR